MAEKSLTMAVYDGDLAALRARLDAGEPVDGKTGDNSALIVAAQEGNLEAVMLLLERGANVNHSGWYETTPLSSAIHAKKNGVEIATLLLDRGADLRFRDRYGHDALANLVELEHPDPALAKLLVDRGLSPGGSTFGRACLKGHVRIVDLLLEKGVDVNEKHSHDTAFSLLCSCSNAINRRAILRRLVDAGVDPNARDLLSGTILMKACEWGEPKAVLALLERGADPNAVGYHGDTPLSHAAESGHPEITEMLLAHGAKGRVPGVTPAAHDEALVARRHAAEADPRDPEARIEYARVLDRLGFRAAAWHEMLAARSLGGEIPEAALADFRIAKPDGQVWELVPFEPQGVAAPTEDSRFPGVRARCGGRELPLAMALGRPCTTCDAAGQAVCSKCNGTGSYSDMWDHDYECERTELCPSCDGTKLVVHGSIAGKGPCKHPDMREESKGAGWTLTRCAVCGLPAVNGAPACGVCGRLDCTCLRGGS